MGRSAAALPALAVRWCAAPCGGSEPCTLPRVAASLSGGGGTACMAPEGSRSMITPPLGRKVSESACGAALGGERSTGMPPLSSRGYDSVASRFRLRAGLPPGCCCCCCRCCCCCCSAAAAAGCCAGGGGDAGPEVAAATGGGGGPSASAAAWRAARSSAATDSSLSASRPRLSLRADLASDRTSTPALRGEGRAASALSERLGALNGARPAPRRSRQRLLQPAAAAAAGAHPRAAPPASRCWGFWRGWLGSWCGGWRCRGTAGGAGGWGGPWAAGTPRG